MISALRAHAAVLLMAAAALVVGAGCASSEQPATPRQPYKVVLLPVEGAERALAANERRGEDFVPLALTPEQFEQSVFEGVRKSNAFSELVVAPPEVAKGGQYGDVLAAAADFARRVQADLLLRVTVKSAEMRDLGNNGSTFWSTFTWFMLPLPTWFADDRTYATNITVEAALYEPRDIVKPTLTVPVSSTEQELDLWDRGLSPWVPIIPPPFLKGSDKAVSETLTERAMAQLMDKLVEDLRTRAVPSRFELALDSTAPGSVKIRATTRRALRSLEVYVAGKLAESWAETSLTPDAAPKGVAASEGLVYTREAKVPASPAQPVEVRVVAEDEAGAREVRTVVLGRRE